MPGMREGREGEREGRREEWREGGREEGREGGRVIFNHYTQLNSIQIKQR